MSKKLSLIFVLILAACGQIIQPEPLTSGIEVQVFVGPMCPVMKVGVECPNQPYQSEITVLDLSNQEVLNFKTNEDGTCKVKLPPGKYILRPKSPAGRPLPYASEQKFEVQPNEMTRLTVIYDSGMR
jgi:hypothetical protein